MRFGVFEVDLAAGELRTIVKIARASSVPCVDAIGSYYPFTDCNTSAASASSKHGVI